MLSSSLRRAAWAPIGPITGVSRQPTQGFAAAASASNNLLGATQRQRRYSSSSSSKPSDGSRRIESSSQTPAKVTGEKREGKASRRKGKDGSGRQKSNPAFSNLPSVPSTQHQQPHDVHVASFFSIHRPISVSTTIPPTSSEEAFDSIFSKRSNKNDADDVIFTLSSAVESMEGSAEQEDSNILTRNFEVDGTHDGINLADLKVSVEELTRHLRPFHPPPPPVPFDESKTAARESESTGNETNRYSTVLTIRESTHADGRKTYEAHTSPFVNDMDAPGATDEAIIDAPNTSNSGTTYIERLRNNRTMHAISTKRRRKAKMKKHKYKKLLRNTRTLRRKLDKA